MPMRSGKNLAWIFKYTATAVKHLKKLDRQLAARLLEHMDQLGATMQDPRLSGKKLVGPRLGEYWRFRVGDYRIICHIEDEQLCVWVLEMGHRRDIYR